MIVVCGAAAAAVDYAVRIEGAPEGLPDRLRELSECVRMRDERPASLVHLERRASRDVETFAKLLRSQGYFEAGARFQIDESAEPVAVVFVIEPGPQYALREVSYETGDQQALEALPEPDRVGLVRGDPALSQPILQASGALLRALRESGYPFPELDERFVKLNRAEQEVDVTYRIAAGPRLDFGEIRATGLEAVREEVIRDVATFEPGEIYRQSELAETRNALFETDLFSVVSLSPLREEAEQGRVPIEVSVRERVHRSIAAGLEYDTDTGAGAVLMWSHRNLTGRGDRLAAEVDLGTEIRRFSLDYLRDRFLRRDQALDFQFASESEDRDAYDSDRIVLGSTLLRATDRETRKGGVGLRLGATEQLDREWDYAVVSAPLVWRVREVDEPLNPAKGWKVGVTLEPVAGLSGDVASYLKAEAEGAVYVPLDSKARWTLAARLRSGSLLGAPMYDLPADLRYYAGGAGSVRGVPYQEAGPLGGEDDDTPLGGRSLLETVLELRHRLNETMGLVAFVDGGAASLDELPGSGLSLNWGAGLGFRYFTPLGPIRADVAVPLNKRDAVDSRFQVYLSIGHSF